MNPAAPSPAGSPPRTAPIMLALCLATFLISLDTVVITTALPTLAARFQLSNAEYAWIGSAYLLTNAASIPLWGKLADIFGRKRVLLLAHALFLCGSVASALARGGAALIAGRAVQGFGGGGVGALVNIVVGDLFEMRARSFIYGSLGAIWAVSCSMGPLIGAGFTQNVEWPWMFWINLPIDAISVLLILVYLKADIVQVQVWAGIKSIDWLGSISISAATLMLLIGLQLGGITFPWRSGIVISLIVFGVCTFGLFFYFQLRVSRSPIMPLRILSQRSIVCALAVTFCDAFVFNAVSFFVPLYFQRVVNTSPVRSDVLMLPMALPLSAVSISAGWLMERTGRVVEPLRAGLLLMTLATGLLISLSPRLELANVVPILILLGIGFGPNFQAPLLVIQVMLQPQDLATGTATFGFVRMLSGAMGIVLCQVVFQTNHSSVGLDSTMRSGALRFRAIKHVWILLCAISCLGLLCSLGIARKALHELPSQEPADIELTNIARSSLTYERPAVT